MPRRWLILSALLLLACNTLTVPLISATAAVAPIAMPVATTTAPPAPTATSQATTQPTAIPATPAVWPPPALDAPGGMVAGPLTDAERAAAAALSNTDYPAADFVALAELLGGVPGPIPRIVATSPANWKVGDKADFWVLNVQTLNYASVPMELRAVSQHAYLWFDQKLPMSDGDARRAGEVFDDIYDRDRKAFGSEPNPGIDGD
ncbi:MAG: hypothetical protein HY023_16945, partial [Chloroflexi bacterium]|nr:hypothetical protein [Chloroflexota bacterium]